jgi:hypothetical protein
LTPAEPTIDESIKPMELWRRNQVIRRDFDDLLTAYDQLYDEFTGDPPSSMNQDEDMSVDDDSQVASTEKAPTRVNRRGRQVKTYKDPSSSDIDPMVEEDMENSFESDENDDNEEEEQTPKRAEEPPQETRPVQAPPTPAPAPKDNHVAEETPAPARQKEKGKKKLGKTFRYRGMEWRILKILDRAYRSRCKEYLLEVEALHTNPAVEPIRELLWRRNQLLRGEYGRFLDDFDRRYDEAAKQGPDAVSKPEVIVNESMNSSEHVLPPMTKPETNGLPSPVDEQKQEMETQNEVESPSMGSKMTVPQHQAVLSTVEPVVEETGVKLSIGFLLDSQKPAPEATPGP